MIIRPSSSAFDEWDYDPVTRKLKVTFAGGKKAYEYGNIPHSLMQEWQAQDIDPEGSAGAFYATNIGGNSDYQLTNDAQEPQPEQPGAQPTETEPVTPINSAGQVPAQDARNWER